MSSKNDPLRRPLVCGHRGAPAVVAENTLEGFDAAFARGATWVEFDVRPAAGGTFVVHHDPVTGDGHHVASTAPADLASSIPTFAEVVARCEGFGLDIELKTDDVSMSMSEYVSLIADEIDTHCTSRTGEILVTSFDAAALAELRALRPETPTGLLFFDKPGEWAVATALEVGHRAIAPWAKLVDKVLVDHAHDAGLEVLTWTVNSPAEILRVAELGVDMIIGDDPAVTLATLDALGS